MSYRTLTAAAFFLAALVFATFAQAIDQSQIIDPGQTSATEAASDSDAMSGIFSEGSSAGVLVTLLGYAIIVGALGVVAWFLFKRGFFQKRFSKSEGKLKVAETRMLGNRQFIMVVEYEDQKILLGVGPGKIDYLTNLNSFRGDYSALDQSEQKNRGSAE